MAQISTFCKLSTIYTNHCFRVTACTVLGEKGFSDIDVQSVSGHISLESLSIYKRSGENKKKQMSDAITSIFQSPSKLPKLNLHQEYNNVSSSSFHVPQQSGIVINNYANINMTHK